MPLARAFRSLLVCGAFAALLVALLLAGPAQAQSDIDVTQFQAVARKKAEEGLELYAAQSWAEAYERFRVAEELYHAPTLVLYMAHCKRELRELIAARALYKRVVDEAIGEGADDAFHKAQATAAAAVSELDEQIPRLSVTVTGSDQPKVKLDGRLVSVPLGEHEIDPGPHDLEATAPGMVPASRHLELDLGAREAVLLELAPIPAPKPLPRLPKREPEPGSLVPGMVFFGVSAAGFILGAIAGGVAVSRVDAIKAECDEDVCPDRLQEDADTAQTLSTVSNVGFVVGGAAAIVGLVLVIVRPGGDSEQAAHLRLGPTSASLVVSF
jgi:hypothetical protein